MFGVDKSRKDNRHPYCKQCRNSFESTQRQKGKRRENRAKRCPKLQKKYMLKSRYNLEMEEYNRLLISQKNLCAICLKDMQDPCVDHNHDTGEVRGLLCRTCNFGLGAFYDDADLILKALGYIEKNDGSYK